jgi:cytochrome c-type biogenesis protein CcmH/NrfF
MDPIIAAPASCKVRAVIRFLHTEGQSAAEIHRRLCRVYGDNVMSDSSEVDPKKAAQDSH